MFKHICILFLTVLVNSGQHYDNTVANFEMYIISYCLTSYSMQYMLCSLQEVSRFSVLFSRTVLNDMQVTLSAEDVTVRFIQVERNLYVSVYLNNESDISLMSE